MIGGSGAVKSSAGMQLCRSIAEMRFAVRGCKAKNQKLGFVPTMGALHEGHLSLVRAARRQCDAVAVSIFVNPTQFGPNEDFSKYPRTFERDRELLEKEGVDLLFAPATEEMYPPGALSYVTVEGLSEKLDGRSRPGHFRGVTTIVSKLFNIIEPDVAFFGQKDAAQVAVVRRMVSDLNIPVTVAVCPIVREPDGLAMSSRNRYLSPEERVSARALSQSLASVRGQFEAGERDAAKLIAAGTRTIARDPAVRLDYYEIVDPDTLDPLQSVSRPALVAVAAFVGSTRLIDNVMLTP
ncbi:MAG TPA: pantoate--beta-alanine ligase [Terriglobales bacterium]|nr:pantoate--beta-alanine ligase [Terriglobales bacterium]